MSQSTLSVFSHPEFQQHEKVSFFHDAQTGLKAIIAIHNTTLGPALGGCRMWSYATDEEALRDVLRLSRGMTYKAAITGLPLGGGKSVIIGDARKDKTPELMRAMGRAVESLGGRYIIAEDVGTTVEDLSQLATQTKHAVGISHGEHAGDPSPVTAYGVYIGLKAAVAHRLSRQDLRGLHVAVQGLGNVGYNLCRLLHADGVTLSVTDVQTDRVEKAVAEFGAVAVALDAIYDVACDVFAPCALGAILNADTLGRIKASVIAGAANNQLATMADGERLRAKNILYAPDYVINAGGLISVHYEHQARLKDQPMNKDEMMKHVEKIADTAAAIFAKADQDGITTALASDLLAEQRFAAPAQSRAA